jgi:Tfp pilus assembly protein PilX
MGRHDADPAGGRRYTGMVLVSVLVAIMLVIGLLALRALAQA